MAIQHIPPAEFHHRTTTVPFILELLLQLTPIGNPR